MSNVYRDAGVDAMLTWYQRAMEVEWPLPENLSEMVTPMEIQEMHFRSCCECLHWYLMFAYAEDTRAAAASLGLTPFQYGSLKGACALGSVFGSLPCAFSVCQVARTLQFRRG